MKVFHQYFLEMLGEGGVVYSRINVCARPDDSCKNARNCTFCHGKERRSRESIIFSWCQFEVLPVAGFGRVREY